MRRIRKTIKRDGITHSYRKAIRINRTIFVSLPMCYCKEHNIKAGDTLALAANSIVTMVKVPEGQPA